MGIQDRVFDVEATLKEAVEAGTLEQSVVDDFDRIVQYMWTCEHNSERLNQALSDIGQGAMAIKKLIEGRVL